MSKKLPIWSFDKPDTFIQKVRQLKKENKTAAKNLGRKMNALAYSEFPNKLGEKKQTKYGEAFVIDIDKSGGLRLSYRLDIPHKIIMIIRFGDHKDVYGKDKKT
jgi:mRNA-degrading endonuclease RelE of RelBE toxin-antitoxin system